MVNAVSEENNASFFGVEMNYADQSSDLPLHAFTHFALQHCAAGSSNTKTQVAPLSDYYYLILDY